MRPEILSHWFQVFVRCVLLLARSTRSVPPPGRGERQGVSYQVDSQGAALVVLTRARLNGDFQPKPAFRGEGVRCGVTAAWRPAENTPRSPACLRFPGVRLGDLTAAVRSGVMEGRRAARVLGTRLPQIGAAAIARALQVLRTTPCRKFGAPPLDWEISQPRLRHRVRFRTPPKSD